ncbi:retropepsin-like aspartic protease family protein [Sphingosinicella soli]|uniref:Aspartyl protease family protein n=1 Tax=Sphingosinicella soli TaxID=333708 RepID=A0A7W7AZX2_9SPHN|nr:TIGR02281 family clan AA aspartic protease [Sphingosinicella soli]MBB4630543.1 aspartyl protease family protein [Sphingosinicella soli]
MLEGLSTGEKGALITSVGFAVIILMSLIPRLRQIGFSRTAKMALSWILIFGGLIFLVAQWPTIRSALDPASPRMSGEEMLFTAREDGHFYVRGAINGESVLFMVDTGATDIVLTLETAALAGFSRDTLRFDGAAQTANGMVRIAGVRLGELTIGDVTLRDVPASVNEGALNTNLLGMRFLRTLESWRVEGDTLILRP